jgi:hypothetical protein
MSTISFSFKLLQIQPDKRQYKTAMPLIEPVEELIIIVDVPFDHEHIYNYEAIAQAEIAGDKPPKPQLTPKGLTYIEEVFLSRIDDIEETLPDEENEIVWEDN